GQRQAKDAAPPVNHESRRGGVKRLRARGRAVLHRLCRLAPDALEVLAGDRMQRWIPAEEQDQVAGYRERDLLDPEAELPITKALAAPALEPRSQTKTGSRPPWPAPPRRTGPRSPARCGPRPTPPVGCVAFRAPLTVIAIAASSSVTERTEISHLRCVRVREP